MRKVLFYYFFLVWTDVLFSQSIVTVEGFAPAYVGQKIRFFKTEDYLTEKQIKIAESTVKGDSTFEVSFFTNEIFKLQVFAGKNHFYMYTQPNGKYDLVIKDKSSYKPQHPSGSEVDFFFLGLDSADINYSILVFEDRMMSFLQDTYTYQKRTSGDFAQELDVFKSELSDLYESDTSQFFKTYVMFAMASIDDLPFRGNRNKYEKYDFYIKPQTVWYQNDRYMEYILQYYDKYASQMSRVLNQAFYDGVLRSSPTMIMNTLGNDYALQNIRLREFVMLKMLKDAFYTGEYPETNIIAVLDSVSTNGLFEANRPIAKRLMERLTDLTPGGKAPHFLIDVLGKNVTLNDYKGKHLYVHFVDINVKNSLIDFPVLNNLYGKYSSGVEFLTIVVKDNEVNPSQFIKEHNISWDCAFVDRDNIMLDRYNAISFPYFVLLDTQGYVVSAPALAPRPNGEYETIEQSMFQIKKRREENEE